MSSKIVNMMVPETLLREADAVAETEGRTRSELFREAVRTYVRRRHPRGKNSSGVLSRIAARAVKGPGLTAEDLDRVIYGTRRRPWPK